MVAVSFDSLNSNRVTATKLYSKNQASVKSQDRDTLIEQSLWGKKRCAKKCQKKLPEFEPGTSIPNTCILTH